MIEKTPSSHPARPVTRTYLNQLRPECKLFFANAGAALFFLRFRSLGLEPFLVHLFPLRSQFLYRLPSILFPKIIAVFRGTRRGIDFLRDVFVVRLHNPVDEIAADPVISIILGAR